MYLFYHIYKVNNWRDLVTEQLDRVVKSGLYKECDALFVNATGNNEDSTWIMDKYPKVSWSDWNKNEWELPTLVKLQEFCRNELAGKSEAIFYFHTKGVTHPNIPTIQDWRFLMEYYCIDNWKKCVFRLAAGVDAVGCNLQEEPYRHFSGNFWWANSKYIAEKVATMEIDANRMNAEFWLASGNGKFDCVKHSNIDHYYQYYPRELYL